MLLSKKKKTKRVTNRCHKGLPSKFDFLCCVVCGTTIPLHDAADAQRK